MLIKLYDNNPDMRAVRRVVNVLRDGGIIIYPTDTIYAIGCDIFHARAVEKICQIKGVQPAKANLSFICQDLSHISEYARISNTVFKLMKRNTPGPFTFILNGSSNLPKTFKQKNTVGIRVPDNSIVRAIVEELGNPLMTASLKDYEGWALALDEMDNEQPQRQQRQQSKENAAWKRRHVNDWQMDDQEPVASDFRDDDDTPIEYSTDPELIDERYGRLVDFVIDGGMGGAEPSTVVDCTADEPVIVRQGVGQLVL